MQDVRDLTGGIIAVGRLRAIGQRHGCPAAQGIVGDGARASWTRQTRQPIQSIIDVVVVPARSRERQSVAVLIVGVGQRDRRLIRAARRAGREHSIRLVVGHGQRTVRICHREQIAHGAIGVAGHLTARQRLAEQLIHGVVGKADGLGLRRHPCEEIVIAIVAIGLHLAEGMVVESSRLRPS